MVALVLVRVARGEVGHGVVHGIVITQVAREHRRIARAGMAAGQGPAAQATPCHEVVVGHHLDDGGALLVLELPHVAMAAEQADPRAEQHVAGSLE